MNKIRENKSIVGPFMAFCIFAGSMSLKSNIDQDIFDWLQGIWSISIIIIALIIMLIAYTGDS